MQVLGRGLGGGAVPAAAFGSPLSSLEGADSSDSQHWVQQQQQQQMLSAGLPPQQQQQRLMVLSGQSDGGSPHGGSSSGSNIGEVTEESSEEDAAAAQPPAAGQQQQQRGGRRVEPKLFVLGNGSGSPCLDLSRVPAALADATVGVDLLVSWLEC